MGLRDERLRRGWSQNELAARSGVGQPAIAKIESMTLDCQWSTVTRLSIALDVAPTVLFPLVLPSDPRHHRRGLRGSVRDLERARAAMSAEDKVSA